MSQEAYFQDLLDQMLAMMELVPGGDGRMQVQLGDDLPVFIEAHPEILSEDFVSFYQSVFEQTQDEGEKAKLHALGDVLGIVSQHGVAGLVRAMQGLDPNPIPEDSRAMWEYAQTTLRMANALSEGLEKDVLTVFASRMIFEIADEMGDAGQSLKKGKSDKYAFALIKLINVVPDESIGIQLSNLGVYFSETRFGGASSNFEKMIMCCENALKVFRQKTHPERWAWVQYNLGIAYAGRVKGDRAENIENAIKCQERALTVFKLKTHPIDWASTYVNMGNAYRSRVKGDWAENIEHAIKCQERVLTVFKHTTHSADWAGAMNNLGLCYIERKKGDRSDNIENAISHFKIILKVYQYETYPVFWARTYHNLGHAYFNRIMGDKAENIEHAIKYYQTALVERKYETNPHKFALTHNCLGVAFLKRIDGDPSSNKEQAIACCENALNVFTEKNYPAEFAGAQMNLGNAYRDRIEGDPSSNKERAIVSYESALPLLRKMNSVQVIRGYKGLADLYLETGQPDKAAHAYQEALSLRSSLILEDSSAATISEVSNNAAGIGAMLAHVCALQGDVGGSVEALEQSRAAGLFNAMRFDAVWLTELDDEVRHQVETLRAQIASLRQAVFPEGVDTSLAMLAREKELEALQAKLHSVMNEAGYQPPNGADVGDLMELVPNGGAVLQLAATNEYGAVVTLLPSGVSADDLSDQHALILPEFDRDTFIDLTFDWLEEYAHMMSHSSLSDIVLRRANVKLEELLAYLWEHMFAPICERLDQLGIEAGSELVLMPQGLLALLPLHAAGIKAEACLLDRYLVRYAPSGFALKTAQQRLAHVTDTQNLFGVINPTADLKQSEEKEWPALQKYIPDTEGLVQSEADLESVVSGIDGQYYVHFAGHGGFGWQNPKDSGLKLANDTVLNVLDIQKQLKLKGTRLVFLSACEAGMVDVTNQPDEYVGLPAAFMQAGAPGVAATFWSVLDIPTAHLVDAFYGHHLKGADPAYALRDAVLSLKAGELVDIEKEMKRLAEESREQSENQASFKHGVGGNSGQGGARSVKDGTDTRPLAALPIIWAAYGYNGV